MEKVIVNIPVYKETLSKEEILSFRQCCKVLQSHPICLITYAGIDCSAYETIASKYNVILLRENYDSRFFKNVYGYNQLMLSKAFYQRFTQYEYMLIYQLDAYIFKDELLDWCNKGYDFIGAPLLEDKFGWENRYIIPNSNNGGFSLRRIKYCIDFLSHKGPILKLKTIYELQRTDTSRTWLGNILLSLLRALGYRNTVAYFIKHTYYNEDLLFCLTFDVSISWITTPLHTYNTWIHPILPTAKESAAFSLERYPSYFIDMYGVSPIGCHAWQKNMDFWKDYINGLTY